MLPVELLLKGMYPLVICYRQRYVMFLSAEMIQHLQCLLPFQKTPWIYRND